MSRIRALASYEVHDFVFTLTWYAGIRNDDLHLGRRLRPVGYASTELTCFHPGSVLIFCTTQYRSDEANKSMKGVPGVMAFESHDCLFFSSSLSSFPKAEE